MDPVVERLVVGVTPDNPAGENLEDTQLLASFDAYRVFGQMAPPNVDTDWREIAALYAELERFRPTPAVRVNRAFAVGQADGAQAGLDLLAASPQAESYPYVHLVRGALFGALARWDEARAALEAALGVARNAAERRQIEARLARLEET